MFVALFLRGTEAGLKDFVIRLVVLVTLGHLTVVDWRDSDQSDLYCFCYR